MKILPVPIVILKIVSENYPPSALYQKENLIAQHHAHGHLNFSGEGRRRI